MDYDSPDLHGKPVTPDALRLFGRFPQDADRQWLAAVFEEEVQRHVRLCELALGQQADLRCYGCELPSHSVPSVNEAVHQRLADRGFEIAHYDVAETLSAHLASPSGPTQQVLVVRSFTVARWRSTLHSEQAQAEWNRREALERDELLRNPPRPVTRIANGEILESEALWATVVSGTYLAEVRQFVNRHVLLVFDPNGCCIHHEPVSPAFDAIVGVDRESEREWIARARAVMEAARREQTPDRDPLPGQG